MSSLWLSAALPRSCDWTAAIVRSLCFDGDYYVALRAGVTLCFAGRYHAYLAILSNGRQVLRVLALGLCIDRGGPRREPLIETGSVRSSRRGAPVQ